MGWDGMGWDGMGWDGIGWEGMGWDGHRQGDDDGDRNGDSNENVNGDGDLDEALWLIVIPCHAIRSIWIECEAMGRCDRILLCAR